jgi:hypothetical protein
MLDVITWIIFGLIASTIIAILPGKDSGGMIIIYLFSRIVSRHS